MLKKHILQKKRHGTETTANILKKILSQIKTIAFLP